MDFLFSITSSLSNTFYVQFEIGPFLTPLSILVDHCELTIFFELTLMIDIKIKIQMSNSLLS